MGSMQNSFDDRNSQLNISGKITGLRLQLQNIESIELRDLNSGGHNIVVGGIGALNAIPEIAKLEDISIVVQDAPVE
jgi:hypothetical protein